MTLETPDAPVRTELEDVMSEITGVKEWLDEKVKNAVEPLNVEVVRLSDSLKQANKDLDAIRHDKATRLQGGRVLVPEGRFAGFDLLDLAIYEGINEERFKDPEFKYEAAKKREDIKQAREIVKSMVTPELVWDWAEKNESRRAIRSGVGLTNPGMINFSDDLGAWRSSMLDVSQKAMDSTTAGSGDELVPTFEAAQLWMDVNLATVVLPVMRQIPMPTQPFRIPTQLGDTNWYPSVENVQALTTDLSTNRVTLDAKGLVTGVPFSDELDEDSIIALVPTIRASLTRNAAEVIDDVLLNGDQTATNGINSDGATIATDTAGKAHWLLGWDGLIHLPLIDNTSQAVNHNAAVSADMFNEGLAKMGKYAAAQVASDVLFISDVNTAIRSLSITEFETVDVAGARNTLSTGEIMNVYGKPYLHTSQMRLADTDGKVTSAGNGTDTGRLLALNTSQWFVGFRRQIRFESAREAGKSQTTMYVTVRIALTERSGTRSTATHTSLLYDITGVA